MMRCQLKSVYKKLGVTLLKRSNNFIYIEDSNIVLGM